MSDKFPIGFGFFFTMGFFQKFIIFFFALEMWLSDMPAVQHISIGEVSVSSAEASKRAKTGTCSRCHLTITVRGEKTREI